MSEPSSFAEFLPVLIGAREARGLSRAQLALLLGMTKSAVDSWERGHRVPARSNAQRWADALEVQLPAGSDGWFAKATRFAVAKCGTRSGAQKHRANDEKPCQPCLDADSAYARDWRAGRAA
jgi:transcriptional regulator with XRE-family HTH domain